MKKILILLFTLVSFWGYSQTLPNYWVPTSGTDTYTTGIPTFGSSFSNKQAFVKFGITNTGAATININDLGAKALKKWDGSAWVDLAASDLKTTVVYKLDYDGTNFNVTGANLGDGGGSGGIGISQVMDSIDNAIDTLLVDPGGATEGDVMRYASGFPVWSVPDWWKTSGTTSLSGNTLIQNLNGENLRFYLYGEDVDQEIEMESYDDNSAGSVRVEIRPAEFVITDTGLGVEPITYSGGYLGINLFHDINAPGDLYQRSAGGYLTTIPSVATGNVLISGGVATVNSWGKVGLSTHVSGTLPVANGGTGTATPALVEGTNVTITGTWPNQTINASGGAGFSFDSLKVSRTITTTDTLVQNDQFRIVYFNSATPINFLLGIRDEGTQTSFHNIGAGLVTFVDSTGVSSTGETTLASGEWGMVVYRTATAPIVVTSNANIFEGIAGAALLTKQSSSEPLRKQFDMLWFDNTAVGGSWTTLTLGGYSDATLTVKFTLTAMKTDGSESYGAGRTATFNWTSSTLTQVGTTTVEYEHETDTGADPEFTVGVNSNLVETVFSSGDADTYRWTIWAEVTITEL